MSGSDMEEARQPANTASSSVDVKTWCPLAANSLMTAKFMPAEVNVAAIEAELTTIDAIPILSAPTSFATTTQNTKPDSDTVRLLRKIHVPSATVSSTSFSTALPSLPEVGGYEKSITIRVTTYTKIKLLQLYPRTSSSSLIDMLSSVSLLTA